MRLVVLVAVLAILLVRAAILAILLVGTAILAILLGIYDLVMITKWT